MYCDSMESDKMKHTGGGGFDARYRIESHRSEKDHLEKKLRECEERKREMEMLVRERDAAEQDNLKNEEKILTLQRELHETREELAASQESANKLAREKKLLEGCLADTQSILAEDENRADSRERECEMVMDYLTEKLVNAEETIEDLERSQTHCQFDIVKGQQAEKYENDRKRKMAENSELIGKKSKADSDENAHVKVVHAEGNNESIYFKINRAMPLRKLMKSYCERHGHARNDVRFVFGGNDIKETDTVDSLVMEDYDVIKVLPVVSGGEGGWPCGGVLSMVQYSF